MSPLLQTSRSASPRSRIGSVAIGALAASALAYGAFVIGTARYLVRRTTRPRRTNRPAHYTFTPWDFQIPFEEIRFPVGEKMVDCWLLQQANSPSPVILGFPGHGGNKSELLGISSALFRAGFSVFLIDFRGAGRSEGDRLTLGHTETEDAIAALDWLANRLPQSRIGVIGFSLGGSVAIQLAAQDKRVEAVVSDSAFATQERILRYHVTRATRLPAGPVLTAARPMFSRIHNRAYEDFAPADVIHQIAPRPIFLIHPEEDRMVPPSEGQLLWSNAREPKTGWFPEKIGHCGTYFEQRAVYCSRVNKFFRQHLLQVEGNASRSPENGTREGEPSRNRT